MANRVDRRHHKADEKDKKTTYYKQQRSPLVWGASVVILVIIVIALVFAPVLQIVGTGNEITFGSYGNRKVSMRWGDESNYMYQYIQNSDSSVTSEFAMTMLWNNAFESAVQREAFLYYLDKAEARVSQNRINDLVVDYYTSDGVFLKDQYLNTSATELRTLETQLEEQERISYLTNTIDGLTILPQGQLDLITELQREKRTFSYTMVSTDTYATEDLQAYVDAHPSLFTTANVALITFETNDSFSLSDIEAEYNALVANPDSFEVLLTNVEGRDEAYGQAKNTGSYARLRSRFSNSQELESYFAQGSIGDISPLMENSDGTSYTVLQLVSEPTDMVLEGQESSVLATIQAKNPELLTTYIAETTQDIVQTLEQGSSMEYVANEKGIEYYTANNNTIQYDNSSFAGANYFGMGGIQGSDSSYMFTSSAFTEDQLKELFSMEEKGVTQFEMAQGTLVVTLDEITVSEEEETDSLMSFGYSMVASQVAGDTIQQNIMNNPLLKNNFTKVFQSKVLGN